MEIRLQNKKFPVKGFEMKPKTAFVVLSYNTKDLTNQCIDSLKSAGGKNLQVVVVDNNSSDGSQEILKNRKDIDYLPLKNNLGFTGGNNFGIRHCLNKGYRFIGIINSDTIVDKDFLQPLVNQLKFKPDTGLVGPKIYFYPGKEYHRDKYKSSDKGKVIWSAGGNIDWDNVYASNRGIDEVDHGQYDRISETDFISGCCLLAKSDTWKKINLFDERYYLYYEDADLSQKSKKIGLKNLYIPQSKIWHINAGSSKVGGDLHDYFITRNRLLFGIKWAGPRAKISLIKESIKLLRKGRRWQKKGIKDFYLFNFGKGSWE
jgi:GT2 family glycosyltransferase